MGHSVATVPAIVVIIGALIAACTDLWKFKVHNLLTLPLLASGLLYHGMNSGGPGVAQSAAGALFGFGVLFLFYLMGGMGGGDVKLMAGVGAWLGLPLTLFVFILSSLAAGIYALVLIALEGNYRNTWANLRIMWYRYKAITRHLAGEDHVEAAVNSPTRRSQCIPFAAMVAIGILGTLGWLLIVRAGL